MTEAATAVEPNGKSPAAPMPGLPEGTLQLPPQMVQRLTRILQADPHVQDVLGAFIDGKGVTGPLVLVLPVVLLVPPQAAPREA
jgi:hypothetical protein